MCMGICIFLYAYVLICVPVSFAHKGPWGSIYAFPDIGLDGGLASTSRWIIGFDGTMTLSGKEVSMKLTKCDCQASKRVRNFLTGGVDLDSEGAYSVWARDFAHMWENNASGMRGTDADLGDDSKGKEEKEDDDGDDGSHLRGCQHTRFGKERSNS